MVGRLRVPALALDLGTFSPTRRFPPARPQSSFLQRAILPSPPCAQVLLELDLPSGGGACDSAGGKQQPSAAIDMRPDSQLYSALDAPVVGSQQIHCGAFVDAKHLHHLAQLFTIVNIDLLARLGHRAGPRTGAFALLTRRVGAWRGGQRTGTFPPLTTVDSSDQSDSG